MVTDVNSNPPLMDIVKIKKEKLTPPATPNRHNDNAAASELDIAENMLDNILGERKPNTDEIKSSNEILADLFKVFNAAPPILDDDNSTTSHHKKKKHKKEKKVKKEKKRCRTNSECKSSADESHKSKKPKLKKSKKRHRSDKDDGDGSDDSKRHKRHKKSKLKEHDAETTDKQDVVVKKEKTDPQIVSGAGDGDSSSGGDGVGGKVIPTKVTTDDEKKSKNPKMQIQVSLTKDNDGSIGKRKIVIKSLVDSTVYHDTIKEVDAKQMEKDREKQKEKEKDKGREKEQRDRDKDKEKRKHSSRSTKLHEKEEHHHHHRRSRSSSLSLSDEETYLRERERVSVRIFFNR